MSTDKLPEWPGTFSPADISYDLWLERERDAALARMEALVEHLEALSLFGHKLNCELNSISYVRGCTCGLSELLAACERRREG